MCRLAEPGFRTRPVGTEPFDAADIVAATINTTPAAWATRNPGPASGISQRVMSHGTRPTTTKICHPDASSQDARLLIGALAPGAALRPDLAHVSGLRMMAAV
jgi:hypothetical protein